ERGQESNQRARRVAKEVAGDQALVAGDLSATWRWVPGSPASRDRVRGMFEEQIAAQEGVDFFIGETFWHLGEALLCLECIRRAGRPAMFTLAFRGRGVTDDGRTA